MLILMIILMVIMITITVIIRRADFYRPGKYLICSFIF